MDDEQNFILDKENVRGDSLKRNWQRAKEDADNQIHERLDRKQKQQNVEYNPNSLMGVVASRNWLQIDKLSIYLFKEPLYNFPITRV